MEFNIYKHINDKKGVSNVETMVYISISLIVLMASFLVVKQLLGTLNYQKQQLDNYQVYNQESQSEENTQPSNNDKKEQSKKIDVQSAPKVEQPEKEVTIKYETVNSDNSKSEQKHDIFYDLNINIIGQILGSAVMSLFGLLFIKSRRKSKEEGKVKKKKK